MHSPHRGPRRSALALILALPVLLAGCVPAPSAPSPSAPSSAPAAASEPTGKQAEQVLPDLAYGQADGSPLLLDAYLPAPRSASPVPAIVVVHGGSFVSGDKSGGDAALVAQVLAQAGYAAFSVDYRLLPEHPYPAALDDVQAAIRWLRQSEQIERFGIDPDRIGGFGGSAGAILIAEAGAAGQGALTDGARLAAVVELSGVLDLTADALSTGLSQQEQDLGLAYLGCADPLDCPTAEEASPLAAVDPSDPPFYLGHSVDEALPEQSAIAMADALRAAGVPAELALRPGSAHSVAMLDAGMVEDILDFYAAHL